MQRPDQTDCAAHHWGDAVVFSPDGKQVAFMREVAGFNQIFVAAV
ncbi:Uncharacterised protein [Serratia fonticola]|uniref:Translocation protein TolB n=1 Tax=Serratia fonticola TaxID=47917 RepID=A0A4U9WFC5_SERFO|nr:Uncharacterised protein [Serratia fonticola]